MSRFAALRLCPFLTFVADCQPAVRILRCCIAFAVPRVCACVCVCLSLSLCVSDRLLFDSCTQPRPSQFRGAGFFEQSENFAIDRRNRRKEEEKEEAEE